MADPDDGIILGDVIVGKDQLGELLGAGGGPLSECQHRRRRIGCDYPVARIDEMAGQQSALPQPSSTTRPFRSRIGSSIQDARGDHVGVEAEAEMVHQGQILAVIQRASRIYATILTDFYPGSVPGPPGPSGGQTYGCPRAGVVGQYRRSWPPNLWDVIAITVRTPVHRGHSPGSVHRSSCWTMNPEESTACPL
jgi:hypothetical protein